ncbi:MAG: quinolinate synthase NadA [Longimicrobiales bacterium]|nr:quinolinate synthase NadA [Longimicrobiales bacterium]
MKGYTPEVAIATEPLFEKIKHLIPAVEWPIIAPLIYKINELKVEKNAVILAHNYQTPDIYHCVADFVGDSLQLAIQAQETEADIIVQAGVYFMAETSKLLSPEKTILIPSLEAGCSLAASINGENVRQLKRKYPGVPVVTYVNTSAEVKAEADICCTSANAIAVVEGLGVERVIMLPDEFLSKNVANLTDVEIIAWRGRCEVHEKFTANELREYRVTSPGVSILAHPECSPEVLEEADFAGSTSSLIRYVNDNRPDKVMMVTECSMSDNVSAEIGPEVEFIRPCNLCPHMKAITLENIAESLELLRYEVTIPEEISVRARRSVQEMINLGVEGRDFEKGEFKDVVIEDEVSLNSMDIPLQKSFS